MKKLKVIIVDDEKPGRENLKAIINTYFEDIEVAGLAENIDEARKLISEHTLDIVFLDIELGADVGFDLLASIPDPSFETIFVTAYEEYAVKAFRTKATDYLLKPVDIDDLRDAILKVKSKIKQKKSQALDEKLMHPSNTQTTTMFLRVSTQDGVEMISYHDILYLQSINYYTNIVLLSGREIICSKTLKEYEILLKEMNFYRIHNSYIINLSHLKCVISKETNFAKLSNDSKITISRRRKDGFLKYLEVNHKYSTEF